MQLIRAVGRAAATRKYDLLSALMAHGLAGDKHRQRLVLRLMALITTRYNWQRDELSMGQREIARLWSVDERTVKRDMARLRDLGWIIVKTQGARGRVSVLGLGIERILLDTRVDWARIGPDFVARLDPAEGDPAPTAGATVVPFRKPGAPDPAPAGAAGEGAAVWAAIAARLAAEDAPVYEAWFARLRPGALAGGHLTLTAPSPFHAAYLRSHLMMRLTTALRRVAPEIAGLRIDADPA